MQLQLCWKRISLKIQSDPIGFKGLVPKKLILNRRLNLNLTYRFKDRLVDKELLIRDNHRNKGRVITICRIMRIGSGNRMGIDRLLHLLPKNQSRHKQPSNPRTNG